ncbi:MULTISPECIES: hypothetical protein [Pseudoxanthomonas]|jgi:hypothetical protein|uniref:Flagellar protein FliT n=1 Tax=Pseudoxanthomonas winnipegensis TaxID=2480810 RepID=A0A4V2HDR1_9GAMM|nr:MULTISPECIES: hypothetical protein [Pseudoxanthomonas]TAA28625.1 hypothetical protein EA660_03330 [Pseudoxanthomonas winnipegensis]TMN17032.1 hypothetical protein FF950_17650 [Pseudoxanthomonas sp. X-1]UAY74015.1 hypothetical protein LAJ50_16315 [Pseudoxanthomonas sp. X-1]
MATGQPSAQALAHLPALPVEQIRDALQCERWAAADELLSAYQHQLVLALSKIDLKTADRGPWLALLADYQLLMDELRAGRDAAAAELARLDAGRRGANAWMRALK